MPTRITGKQVRDDSITGDDVNESSLKIVELKDADEDTKIQVEESPDEDRIRLDTAGAERMVINSDGGIAFGNTSAAGTNGSWNYYNFKGGGVRIQGNNLYCDNDRGVTWGDSSVLIRGNAASETLMIKANYVTYLHLDGSSGRVGVGTEVPTDPIHLKGNVRIEGGLKLSIRDVSANLTLLSSDYIIRCTHSANLDLTLPAKAGAANQVYIIKDALGTAGTNRVRMVPSVGDTIDGAANYEIQSNYGSVTLICDGINGWMVIG